MCSQQRTHYNDFITIFENAINFLKYEYDCILHVVVFVFT